MASEVIKLNIIPTGEMPVFHCSQFDNGRLINIELYRGEDAYTIPSGCTAELHCRKVDNNIVTIGSPVIDENTIKFTSTTQLTACNGKNLCEVAIMGADDYLIGSLNFWLEVELDPLKGGIASTSEIHNLYEQVEDITTEVIGDDYYNKTQVDDLLDAKADKSTTYTKTEVDTALALKANASSVYTKSETDTLLLTKADASDVYTKAQVETKLAAKADAATTYTKTEVDTALALKANAADVYTKAETDVKIEEAIEEIMPVDTAGPSAIASFTTGLALPLVDCMVGITATGGNGTPDNPNPIVGYSSANITRCGVNLFDGTKVTTTTPSNWAVSFDSDTSTLTIEHKNTYSSGMPVFNVPSFVGNMVISGTFGANIDLYINGTWNRSMVSGTSFSCTSGNTYTLVFPNPSQSTLTYKVQLELGNTASTFTPYNGQTYTVNFGQTVYGGVLDVTRGKLKPCVEYPSYNGEALSGRWLSSEATYVEGTTPPTGSQVVSLDDYGADIDLTPVQIRALVGVNNVFGDTNGNTTVKFKDTIQNYIDKKVST